MLVRGIEQRLLPSVIHIAYFILSCPLCTESDKAQCLMGHLVGMQKDTIDAMGCASVAFAARNSSLVSGRYTGEKLLDERVPVLLEAGWRPAPQDGFPDLPQSPRSNGSTGSSAPPAVPQRAAGYVAPPPTRLRCQPPHAAAPANAEGFQSAFAGPSNHTHPLQIWLVLLTSMTGFCCICPS